MRCKNVSAELGYSEVTTQSTLCKDTRSNLAMSCPLPGLSISMEEKPSSTTSKLWLQAAPGRSLILSEKSWGSPGKASGLKSSIARVSTGCLHCWLRPPLPPDTGWAGTAVGQWQTLLLGFRQGNMAAGGLLYLFCYFHTWQGREKKNPKIIKDAWHFP